MADKGSKGSEVPSKPLTMKLFATWEVEKATPNCIPRLCSLTLTRLVILKPLEAADLQSVIIAVKMQNTKRTLRSNDIIMPPNGELDTELHLSFSLQYPHFLKREGNKLQVMLQRRKKYKNRPILGFKTLAMGQINMSQVLQCSVDRELSLYSEPSKEGAGSSSVVAQVTMLALTSQPVDHDENGRAHKHLTQQDQSPDVDVSEDDPDPDDPDYSSNDDLSDSEPDSTPAAFRPASRTCRKDAHHLSRQRRNIKQKFIALLRRFRMSEEVLDSEQEGTVGHHHHHHVPPHNQEELEELFDELENLSESDPELDTISVLSTPKPKLRPFFTGRGSSELLDPPSLAYEFNRIHNEGMQHSKRYDSDTNLDSYSGEEGGDFMHSNGSTGGQGAGADSSSDAIADNSPNLRMISSSAPPSSAATKALSSKPPYHPQPLPPSITTTTAATSHKPPEERSPPLSHAKEEARKALLEQLGRVLSPADELLPESLLLVSNTEWQGQLLSQLLKDCPQGVLSTCSSADVKAIISCVVNKIQKFCNTNSRSPSPIKVAIAGSDSYINSVLAPYVEQFSNKSPDWQNYIKFLIIPLGSNNTLSKFLSMGDAKYSSYFNDHVWRETFDQKSDNSSRTDVGEVVKRVCEYIKSACHLVQLPIAEAMLTCKDKSTEEESSQVFVPFINTAHVGSRELGISNSMTVSDVEECAGSTAPSVSSSPPLPTHMPHDSTPPASPNVNNTPASIPGGAFASQSPNQPPELLDLQVDYWTVPSTPRNSDVAGTPPSSAVPDRSERLQKKDSKSSLKTTFRCVQVYRLPQSLSAAATHDLLSMTVTTKEKKQKILRMGKKSKEADTKSQVIEGISRLICTSKSQNHPLTVSIDSIEWVGVKFFQISAQWQTHIKHFPVLTFGDDLHM